MTAVFAFVFDRKAVVATDTLRVDPWGLFPDQTVQKSYCWKNLIPFGAAGTGAFIQKVADAMTAQESSYQANEGDFVKAFAEAREQVLRAIEASGDPLKKAVASATVLAAVPTLSSPAHILRLDLASGDVGRCPGDFAAEGTDPAEFSRIAAAVRSRMSAGPIDAYDLAHDCLDQAVRNCPKAVGWPMDLRVAERGPPHRAVHLRFDPTMPKDFLKLA